MSLFVCTRCGAIENTALSSYWWNKEHICSECEWGNWHNRFPKEYFDKEKWKINDGFVERIK